MNVFNIEIQTNEPLRHWFGIMTKRPQQTEPKCRSPW